MNIMITVEIPTRLVTENISRGVSTLRDIRGSTGVADGLGLTGSIRRLRDRHSSSKRIADIMLGVHYDLDPILEGG
jgi:hypothetical protein